MKTAIAIALAGLGLASCAAYNPRQLVLESANLPHMCGYGVSPHGTKGDGCPEGWECRAYGCAYVGPTWNGPGTGSTGHSVY